MSEAGAIVAGMGRKVLVVTGRTLHRADLLVRRLAEAGLEVTTHPVNSEPTLEMVRDAVGVARDAGVNVVVGLGGGSALDTAKAVAMLMANGGDPMDYLEVIGRGKPIRARSAPVVAIPTTAGTGSEVTRNAVISATEYGVKASLRSPGMIPRAAIVDPLLTLRMPPAITAVTGLDALTQCIEPFVSNRANPMTDALCREGMMRASRSLIRAFRQGSDAEARADLSLASLFGGLALTNAGLGAVHGFAGAIGGRYAAPHGSVCARLLAPVFEMNVRALSRREPGNPALMRFHEVASILTGDPSARAEDGAAWIRNLCRQIDVPPLSAFGMKADDIPDIVFQAEQSSSMKGNPIAFKREEAEKILEVSLD
jgi:alcohol dehydrogenase class IV